MTRSGPSPVATPLIQLTLCSSCVNGGIGHALGLDFRKRGYMFATLLAHEPQDHLTANGITALVADVTDDAYTMTGIDTDLQEVEKMFGVNAFGPMRMVHVFHSLLIKSQGKIENTGSVGGIVPYVYGASYNATKAALNHWGNTLRVEMKPLGVTMINLISGDIGTKILKRDNRRRLPPDSYYQPLAEKFANHEYASAVVNAITKRRPRAWFWTGARSFTVWFGDTFLPRTVWVHSWLSFYWVQ
ncbi:hypothetical protein BJY01DRAFT_239331 [Aspergillus pseudoustus]|uniref:Short chain dehydrogenase n=1 Tax=Aspergillus pseudoustus TaxID=1810923 RepID=A0ABR4J4N0_9EURO